MPCPTCQRALKCVCSRTTLTPASSVPASVQKRIQKEKEKEEKKNEKEGGKKREKRKQEKKKRTRGVGETWSLSLLGLRRAESAVISTLISSVPWCNTSRRHHHPQTRVLSSQLVSFAPHVHKVSVNPHSLPHRFCLRGGGRKETYRAEERVEAETEKEDHRARCEDEKKKEQRKKEGRDRGQEKERAQKERREKGGEQWLLTRG
eukprot:2987692-Rhodomonas_salina.2